MTEHAQAFHLNWSSLRLSRFFVYRFFIFRFCHVSALNRSSLGYLIISLTILSVHVCVERKNGIACNSLIVIGSSQIYILNLIHIALYRTVIEKYLLLFNCYLLWQKLQFLCTYCMTQLYIYYISYHPIRHHILRIFFELYYFIIYRMLLCSLTHFLDLFCMKYYSSNSHQYILPSISIIQ